MNTPTLIIDSNYLCHRAWFSLGKRLTWEIKPTGLYYGFMQSIISLMIRFQTKKVVFCFDSKYSKRKEIYPPYKAKRHQEKTEEEKKSLTKFREQVIQLRTKVLSRMGFNNIFIQRGYEADDLIAIICREIPSNAEYIIVSEDEDLYQCLRSNVSMYMPRKESIATLQSFQKTYSLNPTQWSILKAIAGCTSDNIPGIHGIGHNYTLNFLTGNLNPNSAYYSKIVDGMESSEFEMFLRLVRLPMEGTQKVRLRKDEITEEKWKEVFKTLRIKQLRYPSVMLGEA